MFRKAVATISPQEPVARALSMMRAHDYSQIPVVSGGECIAVLTASTIARWLGAAAGNGLASLAETSISAVIEHTEESENHAFVARDLTLAEVVELFERYERDGRRLEALLITQSGKRSEDLLGIVTVFDLRRVLAELA